MTQVWNTVVRFAILIGIAMILAQTLPVLDSRWLWFSDEVRYADVYTNLVEGGHWIVLNLNGEAYPDKPPVYFWFLAVLDLIPGVGVPEVLWLGSAVSAILLLLAMRLLAKALGMTAEGFAAGMLVQLSLLGMILLVHYVRMDLLFVAFMVAAQAQFHRHYYNSDPGKHAYIGFALAGVAVLIKGPLGLVLPLASVWGAAMWAGRGARILRRTTALGLLLSVLVVSSWGIGIIAVEGWPFLRDQIIGKQVIERATHTFHHSEPWSYYVRVLPMLFLPWTGLLICLNWRGILGWPQAIRAARKSLGPVGILALGAAVQFVILSTLDGKVAVYILPIVVQLSLLIGVVLSGKPMPRGWLAVAAMLLLAGGAILYLAFTPEAATYQSAALVTGGALIGIALAVALLHRSGQTALLVLSAAMVGWSLILSSQLLPGLNESTSTRIPAEILGRFAREGEVAVAYRTYPGIYSYYAGQDLLQVEEAAKLQALIAESYRIVIAGLEQDLAPLGLTGFETLDSRSINGAGGPYLVLRKTSQP